MFPAPTRENAETLMISTLSQDDIEHNFEYKFDISYFLYFSSFFVELLTVVHFLFKILSNLVSLNHVQLRC